MDFPADVPGCESFARKILEDDINRLVTAIQSLSSGIALTTQINAVKHDTPQVEACVLEVDVAYDKDREGDEEKFCVFKKVSEKQYISVYFFSLPNIFHYRIPINDSCYFCIIRMVIKHSHPVYRNESTLI